MVMSVRSGRGVTTPGWEKLLELSSTLSVSGKALSLKPIAQRARQGHGLPRICMIPVVVFSDGFMAKVGKAYPSNVSVQVQ